MSERGFRCSYCGAPLDVGPDSVVVVCRYCGRPNFIAFDIPKEELGDVLAVPAMPADEAARRAVEVAKRDWELKHRVNRVIFGSPDLYYIPYYFVDLAMSARYSAKVEVVYTRTVVTGRGARTEVVTRRVSVSGSVRLTELAPVLARRAVEGIATERLAQAYVEARPQPKRLEELSVGYTTAKAFLAAEFGKTKAKALAIREGVGRLLREVERDAKERAKERLGHPEAFAKVLDKTVDFDVERADVSPLIYLPAYYVPYEYDGSLYGIVVDGWSGSRLALTEPVFPEERIGYALAASATAGLLGGLGGLLLSLSSPLGIGFIVAGAAAGYFLAGRRLTVTREVEK